MPPNLSAVEDSCFDSLFPVYSSSMWKQVKTNRIKNAQAVYSELAMQESHHPLSFGRKSKAARGVGTVDRGKKAMLQACPR